VLAGSPLWVLDLSTVIHYYEAWLATLAIVVWHLYGVMFRIDVYPMSWVWIRGWLTGAQMSEEHPAELDAILRAQTPVADPPAAASDAAERGGS